MYCGISFRSVGSEALSPAMSARRVSERDMLAGEEEQRRHVHVKPQVSFRAVVREEWGRWEKP